MIQKLFLAMVPVQALAVGLPAINGLLNTSIIGSFIGIDALAAIGFASPLIQIVTTIAVMISTGAQLMCGRYLGEGNKEKIRKVFSTSLTLSVLLSLPIMFLCLFFSKELALLLGATQEHMITTASYIRGYGYGVVFSVLSSSILPFLQLDKAGKHATFSVMVMVISNIGINLLNVFWFKLGIFGAGLAVSVSCVLMVLFATTHFLFKSKIFNYSLKFCDLNFAKEILYQGVPNAVNPICNAFRNRILNHVLLSLGGTVAVSSMTIGDNIADAIGRVIDSGYSGSGRIVASVLAGEKDRENLQKLPKTMMHSAGYLYFLAYAIVFFFAKPLALLMGADSANIATYVLVIRISNIWYLTTSITSSAFCVLQGLGNVKIQSLLNLLNNFIFPTFLLATLSKTLGIPLAVGTAWISNILLIEIYVILYHRQAHKWPPSILEIIYIPESFGVLSKNTCSMTVHTLEESITASEMTLDFCREKGLDTNTTYFCSLCVEEMAVNSVIHGFKKAKRKDCSLDVRIIYEDESITIIVRDDCPYFDPNRWLELCSSDDPVCGIGIRIVSKLAKEMQYRNTLGLNVLTIKI